MTTYRIIRFFQDADRLPEPIDHGLTLEQAQAHCRREDTHGEGWFDGYDVDEEADEVVVLIVDEASGEASCEDCGGTGYVYDPIVRGEAMCGMCYGGTEHDPAVKRFGGGSVS